LEDDLQNFGITGPRSENAAVRSPSEDGSIGTTGVDRVDRPNYLLCYTSTAKRAVLKINRSVLVQTKLL